MIRDITLSRLRAAINAGDPAAMLPEARDKATFRRDDYLRARLGRYTARAKSYVGTQSPELSFSLLRLYSETGNRDRYEKPYFMRRRRFADLAIAVIAGDDSLVGELEDQIWAICDEFSWALPAHLPGGGVVSEVRKGDAPEHSSRARDNRIVIDLFATETGFALSETLALVGDKLHPAVVRRAKKEIRERILESFLGNYPMPWWPTADNNWAAVCGGAVGASFLYECADKDMVTSAIWLVLGAMENFLGSFTPDGACLEGLGYWNYGFGYFVFFSELLREYTGGAIDLMDDPKVKRIAAFQQKMFLSGENIVSFSDGGLVSGFDPGLTHRLCSRCDGVVCPPMDIAEPDDDGCARFALALRNFVWYDPEQTGAALPGETEYLPDAEWLIEREVMGDDTFAFAAKFGNNGEPHNHNDVGTFLLHYNGKNGPMDIGRGEYSRQFFSNLRYTFFCASSRGHSVPIVNGVNQSDGAEFGARDVSFSDDGRVLTFSGDIAPTYQDPALTSLYRTFRCDRKTLELTLEDRASFDGRECRVTERFVSFDEPVKLREGRWLIGSFQVEFDQSCDTVVGSDVLSPPTDPSIEAKRAFYLDVIPQPRQKLLFTAKFTPEDR